MQINLEEQQGWGCLYPMMGSELPSELGKPRAEEPELPVSPPPANLQFPLTSSISPVLTRSTAAKCGALGDPVPVPPLLAARLGQALCSQRHCEHGFVSPQLRLSPMLPDSARAEAAK